ncbi:hypothetical protein PAXRUDRAFT_824781 [Paxillus rubicundulus Ve08.2h10]|uniref:Uncharacterized protein n=1 Tax=Paxillus rubicundulus Ve08.2h10 TaxID=930991 RepID=A0A0D0DHB9_9AGAM|nr:hypothetical protein PAXRUDRAFT_824781 [Paxillus rubicundulus Ve08.2h10]
MCALPRCPRIASNGPSQSINWVSVTPTEDSCKACVRPVKDSPERPLVTSGPFVRVPWTTCISPSCYLINAL